jgi:hypothetical protein
VECGGDGESRNFIQAALENPARTGTGNARDLDQRRRSVSWRVRRL